MQTTKVSNKHKEDKIKTPSKRWRSGKHVMWGNRTLASPAPNKLPTNEDTVTPNDKDTMKMNAHTFRATMYDFN